MKQLLIVIEKNNRRLQIFDGATLIAHHPIALGFAPHGDKRVEGDGKTPEGDFYVGVKNAESKFYRSLGLNYPNDEAARRGLKDGTISSAEHDAIIEAMREKKMPPQKTALGGEIYIHGGGNQNDWTKGCVALEDEAMREIFDLIEVGAKVEIRA